MQHFKVLKTRKIRNVIQNAHNLKFYQLYVKIKMTSKL